jgi:hypothetical protein
MPSHGGFFGSSFQWMYFALVTFNEMLRVNGINPTQVAVLRHTGKKGLLGVTPHDLWQRNDGSFDLYQSTQAPNKPVFERPYWASFISDPDNETLFVGFYAAIKGDRSEIYWPCPMTGLPPGEDKGRPSDLYRLAPLATLKEHRGSLKIQWDEGWIAWVRRAEGSEHHVLGEVDTRPFVRFEASPEGETTWREQRIIERDSKLRKKALAKNAVDDNGHYVCEACNFKHTDGAMFDVHHTLPMLAGPRITCLSHLVVLCPVCHRRAHRSGNRMLPFSLAELRAWNENGRP